MCLLNVFLKKLDNNLVLSSVDYSLAISFFYSIKYFFCLRFIKLLYIFVALICMNI